MLIEGANIALSEAQSAYDEDDTSSLNYAYKSGIVKQLEDTEVSKRNLEI